MLRLGIVIFLVILGVVIPFLLPNTNTKTSNKIIIFSIFGCCLIIFEILFFYHATGSKICIDNVNSIFIFKPIGISFPCVCKTKTIQFSEVDRLVYEIETGLSDSPDDGVGSIFIYVIKKDESKEYVYSQIQSGYSWKSWTGIPDDYQETVEFVNNFIQTYNNSNNN